MNIRLSGLYTFPGKPLGVERQRSLLEHRSVLEAAKQRGREDADHFSDGYRVGTETSIGSAGAQVEVTTFFRVGGREFPQRGLLELVRINGRWVVE